MAQTLSRQILKLFGGSGSSTNFAEFGSQAASAPVKTKSIPTIQQLSAWVNGWQDAVALGEAPYLEDMNGLLYVLCYQILYGQLEGIPEWQTDAVYDKGSIVKLPYTGSVDSGQLWVSLIDANTGNALPSSNQSNANWQYFAGLRGAGLTIPGTATNDAAAAGMYGEFLDDTLNNGVFSGASNTYTDLLSLSLTPGDWDIEGGAVFSKGGATTVDQVTLALSRNSGNVTTDHVPGQNLTGSIGPAAAFASGLSIARWRQSLATPITIYLKGDAIYTGTAPNVAAYVSARRVR